MHFIAARVNEPDDSGSVCTWGGVTGWRMELTHRLLWGMGRENMRVAMVMCRCFVSFPGTLTAYLRWSAQEISTFNFPITNTQPAAKKHDQGYPWWLWSVCLYLLWNFLWQDIKLWPGMVWNLLYNPGWPKTHGNTPASASAHCSMCLAIPKPFARQVGDFYKLVLGLSQRKDIHPSTSSQNYHVTQPASYCTYPQSDKKN